MKKRNITLIIICVITAVIILCVATAIMLSVTFIENATRNPLIGFWQEVNERNDEIHILEFNENGYLTEITLSDIGEMNTDSYSYSFSKRSQTVVIMNNQSNRTYRYNLNNEILSFFDDDGCSLTWRRINNIDFLEKEQEGRKEAELIRQEEEQRRKEEEQRRREEEERKKEEKLQELRGEYDLYRKTPSRDAEIKLLGKWVKDNEMFRDTYEFFENGEVIYYSSDSRKTYTGTYSVYPYDFDLSDEQLLQFESGDFEPSEYIIVLNYDDGMQNSYTLLFEKDYIRFKSGSYGWGWRFDKVN